MSKGLEDVVVDDSSLCFIDGQAGVLRYRGYAVEDLAAHTSYAACVDLLLDGEMAAGGGSRWLVDPRDTDWFTPARYAEMVEQARALPQDAPPMAGLAALCALVPMAGDDAGHDEDAQRLLSLFPLLVLLAHFRNKLDLSAVPAGTLASPAGFLALLHGRAPTEEERAPFEMGQVLQLEHGLNASTFTARVVASTRATLAASLSAAVGALSGSLHGGADERAYRFAKGIVQSGQDPDRAVQEHLEQGGRLMGLGHRVYKTIDPRAVALRAAADALTKHKGGTIRAVFEVQEAIRGAAKKHLNKPGIEPNVEFYKGVVFAALAIPTSLFTPVFALARAAGWTAHVRELLTAPRLYRPRLRYRGEGPRVLPMG